MTERTRQLVMTGHGLEHVTTQAQAEMAWDWFSD